MITNTRPSVFIDETGTSKKKHGYPQSSSISARIIRQHLLIVKGLPGLRKIPINKKQWLSVFLSDIFQRFGKNMHSLLNEFNEVMAA